MKSVIAILLSLVSFKAMADESVTFHCHKENNQAIAMWLTFDFSQGNDNLALTEAYVVDNFLNSNRVACEAKNAFILNWTCAGEWTNGEPLVATVSWLKDQPQMVRLKRPNLSGGQWTPLVCSQVAE